MKEGQIRKALSGFYYVYSNGETYQTRARGNFRKKSITPLVGDRVKFQAEEQSEGYLMEVLPRKTELRRPAIANVDQAVLIMSATEPALSLNLLDRFLVTVEYEKITPIIYLTKIDLLTPEEYESLRQTMSIYERMGYQVMIPERESDQTCLANLSSLFKEKVTVFMGQTGAGKSTLLNKLSPDLDLKTGEISQSLGRGRHTTRHVELHPLAGGLVGDTPGFSSIDFKEIEAVELSQQFVEMRAASDYCQFRGCLHVAEPKCEVKQLVETGDIATSRYENYLQFLKEIEERKPIYHRKK
ncbi:ribosome small subunit-dependent GTPase A [Vagococcus lutrae]|uniref:ribosome small subunit-dependent GTPase A n=1 Tax=Vagococcus lutrae TaxID=81947 RepID=UPI001444879A|nr:ribosome small subunit-dependent GTPase A [Vagococcus lutrae]NKZ28350.1 ribosome small subunit-dependent GTPase A [Vagococcus lutrae]